MFKLVSADLHFLFRYFKISKFYARALTRGSSSNIQNNASTRETSEIDSKGQITRVA
jgi:hypothetical protein